MGALEMVGCAMIAFGPPFALFVFVIARDPLRVILFVAGAFFWLLSLLVSSLLWFAVVPLRDQVAFGLFFSVAFQELFRWLYYLLLKKAERGLEKVSAQGMHIEGVHSLKNAKHSTALVCGLGFGVMAGAFSLVNVLADGIGPGTIGLPTSMGFVAYQGDYTFFVISAVIAAAFILLHVVWNVIFWSACETRTYLLIIGVILSHFLVSGLTLLNKINLYAVSISGAYLVLICLTGLSYFVVGGSLSNLSVFFKQLVTCSFPTPTPSPNSSTNNNNVAANPPVAVNQ